jgi:hypothetical protein
MFYVMPLFSNLKQKLKDYLSVFLYIIQEKIYLSNIRTKNYSSSVDDEEDSRRIGIDSASLRALNRCHSR